MENYWKILSSKHLLKLILFYVFAGVIVMHISTRFASTNVAIVKPTDDFVEPSTTLTENEKDQLELQRLLKICHPGEKGIPASVITKDFVSVNNTRELYLSACYPIEISTSSPARSMGHCSDFVLYIYFAGARLSPQFDGETYMEHARKCPGTTYLHGEYPIPDLFESGARNYWMPNAEQISKDQEKYFGLSDRILAKTIQTFSVIKSYLTEKKISTYVQLASHSSPDPIFQTDISPERDFNSFYHGYGASGLKSTRELVHCWNRHPEWPHLIVIGNNAEFHGITNDTQENLEIIGNPIGIDELRQLQWKNGLHIAPSSREGFGHYINEARAMGALTITTNFGPMNEFVDERSGVLLDYASIKSEDYQLLYPVQVSVTENNICGGIEKVLKIPIDDRKRMGDYGRLQYEDDFQKMKLSMHTIKRDAFSYYTNGNYHEDKFNELIANLTSRMNEINK